MIAREIFGEWVVWVGGLVSQALSTSLIAPVQLIKEAGTA